jgi:hypothetical protein
MVIPVEQGRLKIFQIKTRDMRLDPDIDLEILEILEILARGTRGFIRDEADVHGGCATVYLGLVDFHKDQSLLRRSKMKSSAGDRLSSVFCRFLF